MPTLIWLELKAEVDGISMGLHLHRGGNISRKGWFLCDVGPF